MELEEISARAAASASSAVFVHTAMNTSLRSFQRLLTTRTIQLQLARRLGSTMASQEAPSAPEILPEDWRIIHTAPGGMELCFVNDKTSISDWYYPPGATVAQILQMRGAKRWIGSTEEAVRAFMARMDEERARHAREGIKEGRVDEDPDMQAPQTRESS